MGPETDLLARIHATCADIPFLS